MTGPSIIDLALWVGSRLYEAGIDHGMRIDHEGRLRLAVDVAPRRTHGAEPDLGDHVDVVDVGPELAGDVRITPAGLTRLRVTTTIVPAGPAVVTDTTDWRVSVLTRALDEWLSGVLENRTDPRHTTDA